MAQLTGEYEGKLDAKGRIVLPARLKGCLSEANGNTLMLSQGIEPCLVVYPVLEWNKVYSKVAGMNEFTPEFRHLQRNFFSRVVEVELDGNGRFLIPKKQLVYAGLEKDVVFVGLGNRIEMWNPEQYEKFLIKDQEAFGKLAEQVLGDNTDSTVHSK